MESFEGKMKRTPSRTTISTKLERVANQAREYPEQAFTTLAHLIDLEWLREAYRRTRKDGAAGVDGQTASDYERDLEGNLTALLGRCQAGTYPSRRPMAVAARSAYRGPHPARPDRARFGNGLVGYADRVPSTGAIVRLFVLPARAWDRTDQAAGVLRARADAPVDAAAVQDLWYGLARSTPRVASAAWITGQSSHAADAALASDETGH